jgi:hypothetical protein
MPLTITADQAAQTIAGATRTLNAGRRVPKLSEMLQRVSQEQQVYIYNVGPWSHRREMGSLGNFFIKACPEGREYSEPLIIPGIVCEPYPVNEVEMGLHQEEGIYIAQQVIGVGKHLPPSNSFVKYGVFISTTEKPSKADLKAANDKLRGYYQELVVEANNAYARGPKALEETIQPALHFMAARTLNYTDAECPWLKNSSVAASRLNCEGCGAVYNVGVIVCGNCHFILDPEKYEKNKNRFAKA